MTKRPNIVLIFTDNQQASTLGCYGNPEIHTPNLNRLSEQGVTFDNAFCPNAFCSPCRASVLTGQMPSQHGVHSWIDDRKSADWPKNWHALDGLTTLPASLKAAGYRTALVGKYHLGQPTTPMPGFDHWVTLEDGHVRSFYHNRIFDNGESYQQPGHSVDFFTEKACDFMAEQAGSDQPFFLFLTYPAPYGHWPATQEPITCRHSERYQDCPMDSVPRQPLSKAAVDAFMRSQAQSSKELDMSMLMRAPNDLATLRNYYAQISMVDDGVGNVMAALDDLGLADDTLLIFTSDHGISVGQHGFWGHGAATWPSNLHRAAHSIPMILRQKGVTNTGARPDQMVSNLDLYATVLDHAGLPVPGSDQGISSRSLMPLLQGEAPPGWGPDVMFAEQEETRVIRTPDWVYFKRFQPGTGEVLEHALYNVKADPSETGNLAGRTDLALIEGDLSQQIDGFFETFRRPEADLWQGGTPIQNSVRPDFWADVWGADWAPVYSYEPRPAE